MLSGTETSPSSMRCQLENYEPREEDRGKESPTMALRRIAYRRAMAERELKVKAQLPTQMTGKKHVRNAKTGKTIAGRRSSRQDT